MIEQAKNSLGDDVVLDLLATAIDRRGLAAEPAADRVQLVAAEAFALPAQTLMTHHLDEQLGALLADARAGVLHDRSGRRWPLIGFRLAHRALHGEHKGPGVHQMAGDAGAQIGIRHLTVVVGADIDLGDLVERTGLAAAVESAAADPAAQSGALE